MVMPREVSQIIKETMLTVNQVCTQVNRIILMMERHTDKTLNIMKQGMTMISNHKFNNQIILLSKYHYKRTSNTLINL